MPTFLMGFGVASSVLGVSEDHGFSSRFQPNGLNYVLIAQGSNFNSTVDDKTQEDDQSIEAHYSFKYNLYDCRIGNAKHKEAVEFNSSATKEYEEKVDEIKRNNPEPNTFLDSEDLVAALSLPKLRNIPPLNWDVCAYDQFSKFSMNFSFTGEFDFYAGTRDSGPVINRTSNPAFHGVFDFDNEHIGFLDIGLEHRSDGQVTEIDETDTDSSSPTFGQLKTQIAYQDNDYEYFDGLSRGSDYLSFTTGKLKKFQFSWSASIKYYLGDDTDVNWGPLANEGVTIEDYDIVRLFLADTVHFNKSVLGVNKMTISGEYTVGKELEKTDSIDLNFILPILPGEDTQGFDLPLLFRFHHGPMDRLSDYTHSITSFGVGFVFSY